MRKYFVCAICIALVVLSGCQKQKTDEHIKETLQAETLNVENDVFSLDELMHFIGQDEQKVSEISEISKEGKNYSAKLFGEMAKIEMDCKEGKIQKLKISFSNVDFEAVASAVSEQIGQDGEEKEEQKEWRCEDYIIKLLRENQECLIEISKK